MTKKKAAPKKPETPKERLQDIDLLGAVVSCKPKLRNTALPKYTALSAKMRDLVTLTDLGDGDDLELRVGMKISGALMEGLDEDLTRQLIEFAVEVLTRVVIDGVTEDYMGMTPEERADFIDLHFNPSQLISLFFAAWRVYAVGR